MKTTLTLALCLTSITATANCRQAHLEGDWLGYTADTVIELAFDRRGTPVVATEYLLSDGKILPTFDQTSLAIGQAGRIKLDEHCHGQGEITGIPVVLEMARKRDTFIANVGGKTGVFVYRYSLQ